MKVLCAFWAVLSLGVALGACSSSSTTCASSADCVTGFGCSDGVCLPVGQLRIVSLELEPAAVGVAYSQTLLADGGVVTAKKGYTWDMAEDNPAGWLSIDRDTGELSGTPQVAGSQLPVRVVVKDGSMGQGETVTAELALDISDCLEGSSQVCHQVEEGRCFEGHKLCQMGLWGVCADLIHSVVFESCGPDCSACDELLADRCTQGACRCGNEAPCAGGSICCAGQCVDPQSALAHCGGCGQDCEQQVQFAENPHCLLGRCDYNSCSEGRLNCDGNRSNGCEQEMELTHCGHCLMDCTQAVEGAQGVVCLSDDSLPANFFCEYDLCDADALDCDGVRANGCETERGLQNCSQCGHNCATAEDPAGRTCVLEEEQGSYRCGCVDESQCPPAPLPGPGEEQRVAMCCGGSCTLDDDDRNCGECGLDCTQSPLGALCLNPQYGQCGCVGDADCAEGNMCCGQVCIPYDDQNCGACGRVCDALVDGGDQCNPLDGTCFCSDDQACNPRADTSIICQGEGTQARCECPGLMAPCDLTPAQMCCSDGCVNLLQDESNCGACGNECAPGQECLEGVCSCDSDQARPCDMYGPANRCYPQDDICGCYENRDSGLPCPDGRNCCSGLLAGTGGPDGGADEGCCWFECGQNQAGDCDY